MSNPKILLRAALSIFFFFVLPSTLQAQETVDPQSGRLSVSATDLVTAAGPVNLEVGRTFQPVKGESGLLGSGWRLNFEKRLIKENNRVRIEDERGPVFFTQEGNHPEYKNDLGGRIRLEKGGQAVWSRRDGTRETFDKEGRLTEIDFRNYNKVRLVYGPDKRLARIEGPRKQSLTFASDPQGRIVRIESSTGDLITYQYTKEELTQVQVNGAAPIRYHYDPSGFIVRLENRGTGTVEITYDDKGRVLTRRYADRGEEQHAYPGEGNEHEIIDPAGGVTKRKWSADGIRDEVIDPLGHQTLIEKSALGLPVSITDPLGNKTEMAYDSQGRLISLGNSAGRTTRFEYLKDTLFRTAIIRPDGSKQINQYDGQMNLTEVRRGNQTIFQQTYYPDGAIRSTKELGNPEERYTYDQAGRLSTRGNALGQQTRFEYDPQGNLVRMTNPLGGVTLFKYDKQKQLIGITDPAKGTTRYEYNPEGLLLRAVDPAEGVKAFQYDAMGRIVETTSPSGQKTRYEYDRLGRNTRKGFPDGRSERFAYDRVGNLIEWINTQGAKQHFEYDALGQAIKEKSAAGLEISYGYDIGGNLVSWRDNAGGGEDFTYDGVGRLTELKALTGSTIRYSYDSSDRLASVTSPLGRAKRFSYNQAGNLSEVIEPEGSSARYTFDYAGRATSIKHPSGGETRLTYDPLGNVLASLDPLGQTTKRTFDSAGRLRTVSLPQGHTISYNYDPKGLVIEKALPDKKKILYRYDRDGNPLQIEDRAMMIRFGRDAAGRLTKVDYPHLKKFLAYEYNAAGLISKVVDPEGRTTLYEYDPANRLKSIKGDGGKTFGFTYDPKDRLRSLTYPNGIRGDWEYDAENRVVRLAYADAKGAPLLGWRYRYDSDGNRIEKIDQKGRRIRYRYDQAGQLIEESPEGEDPIRFSYSPGGNRVKKEVGKETTTYRVGRGDQIVQSGAETLVYDNQGNVIETKGLQGARRFFYDPENRMIKVIAPDKTEITYGYAPTGERAWRKDASGLTLFITDGVNVQAELREDLRPKALYLHAPGVDRPLMMTREGKEYYYHPDATGNIMALTDEKGTVTTSYEYDAFGNMKKGSGQSANPFAFSAREYDPATGLYYFRARYYDPELGRFLSKDPASPALDRPFSLNPYLYSRNNPFRYIDPFGQDFTPAEQLYIAEAHARFYSDMARNPQKYGLPQGAFQNGYLEEAQRSAAEAEYLRARNPGLTPQRPAVYGPNPGSMSSGAAGEGAASGGSPGGNRPTVRVNAPVGENRPGTIKVNVPGSGGANAPSSAPGGITRPGFYGAVGGVLGTVGAAVNLQACLDEGNSKAWCVGQLGLGVAVGAAAGGILVAAGVPATVLAVGGAALAGAGTLAAGGRWSQAPETRAQNEQRAAQQAQTEARIKNVLANLEGRIGALIALGKEFCDAQSKTALSAMNAQNTAEAARKNLESAMGSLNAAVTGSFTNSCTQEQTKLVNLAEKIRQAEEWIDKAGRGYPGAIQKLTLCASQKDIDDADYLLKGSTALSLSAERKVREALADIDALQKSVPRLKETVRDFRSKMSSLENSVLVNQQTVDNYFTETVDSAKGAEEVVARFRAMKAELQQSASKLTAMIPPPYQEDLQALVARINNAAPPCPVQPQLYVDIAKSAKERMSGGSFSSLSGIGAMFSAGSLAVQKAAIDSALDTCGNLNPPSGREADNASLALVKLTDKIQDWLKTIADYRGLCLTKLYPKPQPPAPPKPPTTTAPPPTCTYSYSAWSECLPDGTRSRTILSGTPAGCAGTPVITETCTYKPPPPPVPAAVKVIGGGISCTPMKARQGNTIACTVSMILDNGISTYVEDVTANCQWGGLKPPYTARKPGPLTFTCTYLGFTIGDEVIVVEDKPSKPPGYDPRTDPELPGKGKPVDTGKVTELAGTFQQGQWKPLDTKEQNIKNQPPAQPQSPGYLSSTTTTTTTTVPPGGTTIPTTVTAGGTTGTPGGTTTTPTTTKGGAGIDVTVVGTAPPGMCRIVDGQLVSVPGYTERIKGMTVTLTGPVNKSAVSSGSGSFNFSDIPAGNYVISVQGWDYGMTKQPFAAPSGKSVKVVLKGSCPYLYVWDGERYQQENDIYSVARLTHWDVLPPETRALASREGLTVHPVSLSAVSAQLRRERSYRDYYGITKPLRPDGSGQYRLQIREQASEHSWTDLTELIAVDHAPGRAVGVTRQGDVVLHGELQPAGSFTDLSGQTFAALPVAGLPLYNGEGLVFDLPPDAWMSGVMMVSWQGFRDGVGEGHTASQGLPRLRMERLDAGGNWLLVDYGYPRDEIQKTHFLLAEEKGNSMTSRVRLVAESCVAEKYHRIDGIFWGKRAEAAPGVRRLPLLSARTSLGEDVTAALGGSDGLSVLLGPEESIELRFDGAPLSAGEERSFIFVSEGVYMPMPYLNVAAGK